MKKENIVRVVVSILVIAIITYISVFNVFGTKSIKDIKTGLDISGGVSLVYEAKKEGNITNEDLDKATTVLRKRLEAKNIFDAVIRADEAKGYIYVEIPAKVEDKTQDPLKIVEGLDKTAIIQFRDEDGNVVVAGQEIKSAKYDESPTDSSGIPDPHVTIRFTEEGRKKFAEGTKASVGKTMPIYLDDTNISSPQVSGTIDSDTAMITIGGNTLAEKEKEAKELAMLIDSGSLPFKLEIINKEYIGPTLGQKALDVSILAGIICIALVMIIMIILYRIPGVVSSITLILYAALFILILSYTGITLTLPGIASLILSLGMAVDANVIIFERLKEELKNGKTGNKAFETSFQKVSHAIIDGNVTTLIIAILLYIFGIGPIKGFGIVLAIGVLLSMFTALFVTKYILKQFMGLAKNNLKLFGLKEVK